MLKGIFKNSYRYSLTRANWLGQAFHGFKPTPEKLARHQLTSYLSANASRCWSTTP